MPHNEKEIIKNLGKGLVIIIVIVASMAQPLYEILGGSGAALAVHVIVIGILLKLLWNIMGDVRVRMQGAGGEKEVRLVLKGLDNRFRILGSVVIGRKGDMDFVVVGPTGVWVIEVKSHKGRIRVEGKTLVRDGKQFDKNFVRQVMGASYALKDALRHRIAKQVHIQSVVVFSSPQARVGVEWNKLDDVYVVGIDQLTRLIERKEVQRLTTDEVERIFDAIRTAIREN